MAHGQCKVFYNLHQYFLGGGRYTRQSPKEA